MGYELNYWHARVHAVRRLTPGMVRVRFGGEELAGWQTTGVPDEYVRLLFPPERDAVPALPQPDETGLWNYPDGAIEPVERTYTIRHADAGDGTIDIDFALHDGGIGSAWARQASPGQVVGITAPYGLYRPPADADWHLYAGDPTALPAIGRAVEQLPRGTRVHVVVEVDNEEERQAFATAADIDLTWLLTDVAHGPSKLPAVVRDYARLPGKGYIWVAGEAGATRAARKHLRHELKRAADTYTVVGYWRYQAEEWNAKYEKIEANVLARLDAAREAGRSEEELVDEYEASLDAAGL